MRNKKTHPILPALLCGAALFTFACSRAEVADPAQAPAAPIAEAPQANELQPAPQSVRVEEQAPPAAVDSESPDLSARERELADREAELDARERRLRETQTQALIQPRPAPSRPAAEEARPEPPRAVTPELEPAAPAPEPEPESVREEPRTASVTVPAGAQIDVEFTRRLASNTSSPGDSFRARVNHDLIQDGIVAIPAGSEILGEVTEAVPLRKVGGQAKVALRFTDLVLPSGKTVPIDASFVQQGRNETGKDAATIGGAAAGGAILGRILNKGSRGKGAVIGAIIGAAAGTAIASKTPGEEVVISTGSVLSVRLDDSVQVERRR